jgi:serine/threonine protein kinase/tetratricopeptide (TPR) repeat protein
MSRRTYSHYEVLEKLGEGGMGVVYKARDQRLDRLVALKMLPSSLSEDPEHRLRFIQEARAASALNHPNIVTIYEIHTEGAATFIAMEYIRGRTLDSVISAGRLGLGESLRVALQVADGLAAAHAAGILHRDLKPANVMLTDEGYVKLLDFGLARHRVDSRVQGSTKTVTLLNTLTTPGIVLGTVPYMSPEQAEGADLDSRSDIFAFGTLLYEMVTGSRAFQGSSTISILSGILRDQPRPVRDSVPDIPLELESLIARCLEKDRRRRFAQMSDVRSILQDLARGSSDSGRVFSVPLSGPSFVSARRPSIAVLPFANMSPDRDNEYFSDGLSEEIITALSQIDGLQVTARTSAFAFRGPGHDIRAIGEKLNVGTVLEGSVRRAGNRVRITAQLINVADGFHLWSERYDRELTDVFEIQEEIARAIVEKLRVRLTTTPSRPLVRRYTENLEAYDLYLKGQYQLHRFKPDALSIARSCFERAIECDPDYALAFVGLSYYHGALAWFGLQRQRVSMAASLELCRRALQIDDSLAEAHMLMGLHQVIAQHDWIEGERCFHRALGLKTSTTMVAENYAMHFLAPIGQTGEAVRQLEALLERDPLSLSLYLDLGWVSSMDRQPDRAIGFYRKALEIEPSHYLPHVGIGANYRLKGMPAEALEAFETAHRLGPDVPMTLSSLAGGYALAGRRGDAVKILRELLHKSEKEYVPANSLAYIYAALEDLDNTFTWLEKAIDEHEGPVLSLKIDPTFDFLRSDPRYPALLEKLHL